MLTYIKEEIETDTVTVGDFNTPLTPVDRTAKQSLSVFSIFPHVFGHEGCEVTECHGLSFFNVEL